MLGRTHITVAAIAVVATSLLAQPTSAPAASSPPTLTSTALRVVFSTRDPEQVTSVQWKGSANLAVAGGPVTCGSPSEFFGESYGAPEDTLPVAVFESHLAASTVVNGTLRVVGAKKDCDGNAQTPKVDTGYSVGTSGLAASTLKVTRNLFVAGLSYGSEVGIRDYVARLSNSTYSKVLVPNATSTGTSTQSLCDGDCFFDGSTTPSWNGAWFADLDPVNGHAMVVSRSASDTTPVELDDDQDAYSNSNATSIVLVQPSGGYTKTLTETESLCFVDLTSWPQSMRNAGKKPTGC